MIRDILLMVSGGGRTLESMAKDLGIPGDNLRQRFMELELMGYIKKLDPKDSCDSRSCSGCPVSRSCSGEGAYPKMYELTDKGKRVIGRGERG